MLGCHWRLQAGEHDGLTFVRRPLQDRLQEAADLLDLRVVARWSGLDGPGVRRLLAEVGPLYVVGEAYDMPWLPYAGCRYMPHSFLVEAGDAAFTVVDAYHNDTQWGPARPGAWTLTAQALDRVFGRTALAVALRAGPSAPAVDPAGVLAANAARAGSCGSEIERYLDAVRAQRDQPGAAERLAVDIWILGRERLLFAAWLAGVGRYEAAAAEAARLAGAWRQLTAASYLAMRRAERGAPAEGALVDDVGDRLRADAAFAVRLWREQPADGRGDRC